MDVDSARRSPAACRCPTRRAGIAAGCGSWKAATAASGTSTRPRASTKPIAELPGFTRGLDFLGPLAFVGLSQVRESAVFSGIPIAERLEERTCGVWVVDLETGRTVAFVRFEDAVQEIFAVEVLAGIRFPDLINHDPELIGSSYVLPDAALADVPAELRST